VVIADVRGRFLVFWRDMAHFSKHLPEALEPAEPVLAGGGGSAMILAAKEENLL
jgi:hypothetical protein